MLAVRSNSNNTSTFVIGFPSAVVYVFLSVADWLGFTVATSVAGRNVPTLLGAGVGEGKGDGLGVGVGLGV